MKKLLSDFPELAKQWHPSRNGDLEPSALGYRSGKKVWWICENGHEFEALVSNRNKGDRSTGCPYCSGKKATPENCLSALSPKLAKQWHPSKNGSLNPDKVTNSSHKKVWWLCSKGHSYQATVANRSNRHAPTGCPYCAGKKATPEYNLQTEFPDVAAEWHPTKNQKLKPTDVPPRGGKKYWWLCQFGHEYFTTIDTRTRSNTNGGKATGCPYCAGRKVNSENNLKAKFPSIAKEWNHEKNKDLRPSDVYWGSHKKVWWKCLKKGHQYAAKIESRTRKNTGCPFCANKMVSEDNNLSVLSPSVAAEWHPTKNGTLLPKEVVNGSYKKVWWLCPKGHAYKSAINERTGRHKTGCNKCTGSSKPEFRLLAELKYVFPNVLSGDRSTGREIDIFIPDLGVAIEHDGAYWHRDKDKNDQQKNEFLKSKCLTLVRVRHHPLKKLSQYDVVYKSKNLNKSDIDKLLSVLNKITAGRYKEQIDLYLKQNSFLNHRLYEKYLTYFPSPLPERSVQSTHPELVADWDYEKNMLGPEHYTPGVDTKVWWICRRGHPSYSASIGQRVRVKSGCPKCSHLKRK